MRRWKGLARSSPTYLRKWQIWGYKYFDKMPEKSTHRSVLLEEAVALLNCRSGGTYVDATLGGGGHAERILERSFPDGVLIGIDLDPDALKTAEKRLAEFAARTRLIQGNFSELSEILQEIGVERVDGILLDLGISSFQLDDAERGFSFLRNGPLDMRMDPTEGPSAADLVNTLTRDELAGILLEWGEERWAKKIATEIVKARKHAPITRTRQLVEVIERSVPARARESRIHPATRAFQALRIAVNRELEALEKFLASALDLLVCGGRLVVISFHSLEDRIVKKAFSSWAHPCTCPKEVPVCVCGARPLVTVLTRRPVRPSEEEVRVNPRARSARLRAIEKLKSERGSRGEEIKASKE